MVSRTRFYRSLGRGFSPFSLHGQPGPPITSARAAICVDQGPNLPYKRGESTRRLAVPTLTGTPKTAMLVRQRRLWERACEAPIRAQRPCWVVLRPEPGVGSAKGLVLLGHSSAHVTGNRLGANRDASSSITCSLVCREIRGPRSIRAQRAGYSPPLAACRLRGN